jgi:DNA (cytosine-5)-methyltransferase 1
VKAIDLFAGAGGFSVGAKLAGCEVAWAANHWPAAVAAHAANHPETAHVCQDLHQADWSTVPRHDLLLASPACQGHSIARGRDRPHHDKHRSTAWAVVSALEHRRPPLALVENVVEFTRWRLYPAWAAALQSLGYSISPQLRDAADHGVPQHRRRLFLVIARARRPMQLRLGQGNHLPASSFIRFDHETWSPINRKGRAAATKRRIAAGRHAHGDRFLMPYYKSGSGLTGRSIERPIGTITTRDRWAVIDGSRMRMLTVDEARAAMGFPASYALPKEPKTAMHLLGNAVYPPVARDIIRAIVRAA